MHTNKFHLLLTSGTSLLLGATLMVALPPNDATAFPKGPSVAYGSNPVFSVGGLVDGETVDLFSPPEGQMIVVTDVLYAHTNNNCRSTVTLSLKDSAEVLSKAKLHSFYDSDGHGKTQSSPQSVQHAFNSGIPVNIGETLQIHETGGCDVVYTLSGYYAQP